MPEASSLQDSLISTIVCALHMLAILITPGLNDAALELIQ